MFCPPRPMPALSVPRARSIIFALNLFWCSILVSPARATTYTVCSDAAPNQCNFYSITHALADRDSAPGCTLLVKAGTYRHPNAVFKATAMNASSGSPTVLKANGYVVIDGADSLGGATWTQEASDIYSASRSVAITRLPRDTTQSTACYVFVDDNRYKFIYNNFSTLNEGEWSYDSTSARVYVRLAGGGSPAGRAIYMTDNRRQQAFDIEWSDNFVIDGFTIKRMAGAGILIEGDESNPLIARMLSAPM